MKSKKKIHFCRCEGSFSRLACKILKKPECMLERVWDRVSEKPVSSIQGQVKVYKKASKKRERDFRYHKIGTKAQLFQE